MSYNENLSESLAVLGVLAPASQSTTPKTIGPFSTKLFQKILFDISIGALGAGGTIDFKVQASATQGGTYADVAGTAITQVTAGATNFIRVEVRTETLGNSNQGPWIQGVLTPGTAASQASVVAYGIGIYSPANKYNVVAPAQTLNA